MSEEKLPSTIIKKSDMKKILKANDEIGKLCNGFDALMAIVVEQFAKDLIEASLNDDKTSIELEKLINAINTEKKYDFLQQLIPNFPQPKGK